MQGRCDADDALVITSPHQVDGMPGGGVRYLLRLADTPAFHEFDIEEPTGSGRRGQLQCIFRCNTRLIGRHQFFNLRRQFPHLIFLPHLQRLLDQPYIQSGSLRRKSRQLLRIIPLVGIDDDPDAVTKDLPQTHQSFQVLLERDAQLDF